MQYEVDDTIALLSVRAALAACLAVLAEVPVEQGRVTVVKSPSRPLAVIHASSALAG